MGRPLALLLAGLIGSGGAFAFDLQGHRGARGLAPENTLAAFDAALSLGVDTLELDTVLTRDGVVVVSHDTTLNPNFTRDAQGRFIEAPGAPIRTLTLVELQRYDVGRLKSDSPYAKNYPEQAPVDGTRIPRLSEVFDLVKRPGNRDVQFDIETKVFPLAPGDTIAPEAFARRLIAENRRAGMERRTMIQSFEWSTLQVVQREAREMRTVYLTIRRPSLDNICTGPAKGKPLAPAAECEASPWTAGFQLRDYGSIPKMVKAAGGDIWSPYFGDLDEAQRREAKSLGLRVIPWTVNDPEPIAKMLDLEVDGIISDRPDRVREEMRRRGMPLPLAIEVKAP